MNRFHVSFSGYAFTENLSTKMAIFECIRNDHELNCLQKNSIEYFGRFSHWLFKFEIIKLTKNGKCLWPEKYCFNKLKWKFKMNWIGMRNRKERERISSKYSLHLIVNRIKTNFNLIFVCFFFLLFYFGIHSFRMMHLFVS